MHWQRGDQLPGKNNGLEPQHHTDTTAKAGEQRAVASDTDHGKKSFRPLVKRDAAVLQETKHFLHRVYHGSLSLMVSSLTQKQALPQEEIDALYALLRELEEKHDVDMDH